MEMILFNNTNKLKRSKRGGIVCLCETLTAKESHLIETIIQ